jgi:hypothetical protein
MNVLQSKLEKKQQIIDEYKNKKLSFYIEKKKYLSFYNVQEAIPTFKKMHSLLINDTLFIENIEKKIDDKNKKYKNEIKSMPNVHERMISERKRFKEEYEKEYKKMKKYGKNKQLLDTQSSYCETVNTVDEFTYRLKEENDDEAIEFFKNFVILRKRVIQSIPLKEYLEFKNNKVLQNILESNQNFILDSKTRQNKYSDIQYEDTIRYFYKVIASSSYCTEILHRQVSSMCFYFLEFLYFIKTRYNPRKVLTSKYFTGQPEHINIFFRAMIRLTYYMRVIKKSNQFDINDILFYLDLYVPNEFTYLEILNELEKYLSYTAHYFKYLDIFNSLLNITLNSYIRAGTKLEYLLEIDDIKTIIYYELQKFFLDKVL